MNDTTTLKKSLLMIQKLKKLAQENNKFIDPIAIIGMSCRLPEVNKLNEFWDLLCSGKNIITRIPQERWELLKGTSEFAKRDPSLAYWGGYLKNIDAFDAYFFGISPREAIRMDPQQRILLEVAYESLEDAGLAIECLAGSNMGVFSSLYASQLSHLQKLDSAMDALFISTGSAISMAANRLSYLFDLRGPSIVLDTACSSSLIAIQLACYHLQAQLCDTALVSAVHINLLPSIHAVLAQAKMLSPTGQCHTFDARADGYVQGEGAGSIVLKPLSKALSDQNRIYAIIMGSAVNQDGKTNGLTAPNGLQQEQLLRKAYQTAKTSPARVSYIECHGTGTFLGDPIEIQALGEVLAKDREAPCWIGSVKTNIGHLEPAAGIVSMIKTALILKNGLIPPHLNFTNPNPHIPFDRYSLHIPTQLERLPQYGEVSIAGVSGFGFGGANAHIVLRGLSSEEQAPGAFDKPRYSWQHKKYWPLLDQEQELTISYPLRGRLLSSPLPIRQFEFIFDTKTLPEIQDSFHVLHTGYYLEMFAFALSQLGQSIHFSAQNLTYLSPLIILDNKTVLVQLLLKPHEHNAYSVTFYSHDGKKNWIEHALGILSLETASNDVLESVQSLINHNFATGESFYQRIINMGMPAGDSIRWVKHYWSNQQELFCELRQAKLNERSEQFTLNMHPGIIDACVQTLFLLLPTQFNKPYVASHMDKIKFYGINEEPKYIYTFLKGFESTGKKINANWYLLDKNYRLLAQCEDLCMTELNDNMKIDQIIAMQSQFHLDFSLPFAECKTQLIHFLREELAVLFSMPHDDMDPHQSLLELGMDSLLALAIIRVIESNLELTYSIPLMMQGPSINEIAEYVLARRWTPPTSNRQKSSDNIWIANRKIQTNAKIRLFCFPYGGGGASIYREWQQEFSEFIEVCPVQLPGRETRMNEAPLHHLEDLIALLTHHLQAQFNLPFAFFGHSFGSLIGFELARYLHRQQLPQPSHLFISAYPDPRQPSKSLDNLLTQLKQRNINLFDLDEERIGQLNEEQLAALSMVFQENGMIDYSEQRMNQNMIRVLLPIFIADMNIAKNYVYHDEPPLKLKTNVFLGKQDTWVPPEDLMGWADHFSAPCEFHSFDSGHLFIREKEIRTKIIQKISAALLESF